MNKQMIVSVLVKLLDHFTAPLKRMEALVSRIAAGPMDRLKRMFSGIGERVRNLTGRVGELTNKMGRLGPLGALGAGLGFVGALKTAASFDSILRDIGITAGLSGKGLEEMISGVGPTLEKLSLEVGQRSTNLAEGLRSLVASGLELPTGLDLMRTIGRVATAAGAEVVDVSRSTFSLFSNLKEPVAEMEGALGMLVIAGKLGRFEFRDMARYLPELTAGIQRFGLYGKEAVATLGAAAQVGMFGTSDPSIAANNLREVFNKFFQKDVIENFKKEAGIDITKVIQTAPILGKNAFDEAIDSLLSAIKVSGDEIEKIYKAATDGGAAPVEALERVREHIERVGGAARMQRIFGDKQALDWLSVRLAKGKEYKEYQAAILKGGAGVIGTDFISRMAGLEAKMMHFAEVAEQATRRAGLAFSEHIDPTLEKLKSLMGSLDAIEQRSPGLVGGIVKWGATALIASSAAGVLTVALKGVAAVTGILAGIIGWPALIAVGLAGAAAAIIANWTEVKLLFEGVSKAIDRAFTVPGWVKQMAPNWAKRTLSGEPAVGYLSTPGQDGRSGFAPPVAPMQSVGGKIGVDVTVRDERVEARARVIESESRFVPIVLDRGPMLGVP